HGHVNVSSSLDAFHHACDFALFKRGTYGWQVHKYDITECILRMDGNANNSCVRGGGVHPLMFFGRVDGHEKPSKKSGTLNDPCALAHSAADQRVHSVASLLCSLARSCAFNPVFTVSGTYKRHWHNVQGDRFATHESVDLRPAGARGWRYISHG